jgi:hypothetical protein
VIRSRAGSALLTNIRLGWKGHSPLKAESRQGSGNAVHISTKAGQPFVGVDLLSGSTFCRGRPFVGVNLLSGSTFSRGQSFVRVDLLLGSTFCRGRPFVGVDLLSGSTFCRGRPFVRIDHLSGSTFCVPYYWVSLLAGS